MSAACQCTARGATAARPARRAEHQARLAARAIPRPVLQRGSSCAGSSRRQVLVAAANKPVARPVQPEVQDVQEAEVAEAEKQPKDPADVEALRMETWGRAIAAMKNKETVTIILTKYNFKGFVAKFNGVTGFIPFTKMDQTKLPEEGSRDAVDKLKALLGTLLSVKIVEADISADRLIFSELADKSEEVMKLLNPGVIMDGVVNNVTDYGAFVSLKGPDGQLSGVTGMVHKSELSWEMVTVTSSVVKPKQAVKVKVLSVDRDTDRIALSIRQCTEDPLQANLDSMIPLSEDEANMVWQDNGETLDGLDDICRELRSEDGVLLVTPGRQAEASRVVSQDLQIFMTKESVMDGFNLVARLGNRVQEVQVATDMSREEMKQALTRTLQRVAK
eukprot:jgi/Tetstr1/439684/TSEL_028103.t1